MHPMTSRTTIYITDENKKWLDNYAGIHGRTKIINEAIAMLKEEKEKEYVKAKLLNQIDNIKLHDTNSVSPKDLLEQERNRNIKSKK